MKKTLVISLLSIVVFFISCEPAKNLDEHQFLIGKWEGGRDGMTLQEIWNKESNERLSGQGVVLSDNDTLFHEKIAIELRGNEIYYVATVPSNDGPVSFKLISSEKNKWSYENKEHDFPQKITYTFIQPDSLIAVIEGMDKGKTSREVFRFKKTD